MIYTAKVIYDKDTTYTTNPPEVTFVGEKMYTTGEVARLLGVDYVTVARWARDGKIKAVRTPGGHWRIPESEVKRLLGEKGGRDDAR